MRSCPEARLALAVLLLIPAFGIAASRPAYPDQPVPAHTGGFGEPTCRACHFDGGLNEPGGTLAVEGWPEAVMPDSTYPLAVRLERAEMARAGFQLAIRAGDGAQAGALRPADARSAVTETPDGVQYLHHTLDGTALTEAQSAVWSFTWTPPDSLPARLVFHVAANAANGDASEFGDWIYADSLALAP